jgi:hypothetical protein
MKKVEADAEVGSLPKIKRGMMMEHHPKMAQTATLQVPRVLHVNAGGVAKD